MKKIFQFLILIYQKTLSPFLGNQCRFSPTCSCYMHEALEKHGTFKGLVLGSIRILKCNPWIETSWMDPVPERFAWRSLLRYKTKNQN